MKVTGSSPRGLHRSIGRQQADAALACPRPVASEGTSGCVIWITGLAGTGKTTVASALYHRLRVARSNVILLDGDALREALGGGFGHCEADRRFLARAYAGLCRLLSEQGQVVLCATVSLFSEIQDWNRQNIARYFEVHVDVPPAVLIARDPGGLYSSAAAGDVADVVGVDLICNMPPSPEFVIDNAGSPSALETKVEVLYRRICEVMSL